MAKTSTVINAPGVQEPTVRDGALVKGIAALQYLGRRHPFQINFKIDGVMTCFCFDRVLGDQKKVCFIPDPDHSFVSTDEEGKKVRTTVVEHLMSMTETVDDIQLPRFKRLQ